MMDPWKLTEFTESHDGWASVTQSNLKLHKTIIVPEWTRAWDVSPWLKTLLQQVLDSARVVPSKFPGNLLQPSGSGGKPWMFFKDYVRYSVFPKHYY